MRKLALALLTCLFLSTTAYGQGLINLANDVTGVLSQANGGTGYISVATYGALGLSADDCPAIQNAINAAEAQSTGGVVTFQSTVYNCKTNLTFDPGLVSFQFNGAVIYAGAMTTGALFTITATRGTAALFYNYKNFFENFFFIGPGSTSSVNLFVFNTPNLGLSSRMSISHGGAYGFNTAETYENGSYLISVSDVEYGTMGTCFSMPSGFANYGENISHSQGGCFNSNLGVYTNESALTNTQNFDHFSFDYDLQIVDDEAGVLNFDTDHFEGYGQQLTGPLWKIANANGAVVRIHGGDWFLDDPGPFSGTPALIEVDGQGTIDIDNMFMHNLGLTSGTLAQGTGNIHITNTRGYLVSLGNYQVEGINGINENYMSDGGFEQPTIQDSIWISADSAPITNRFTGANISLANDSATCGAHSGNQSLKINKNLPNFSYAIMYIAVPVERRQMGLLNFWYSKPGTQTGVVYLNYYAIQIVGYNGNGTPIIGKQSPSLGAVTVNLTSSPLPWTQFVSGQTPQNIIPLWATHMAVQVNANGMNPGAFCIDDFVMNSI